jgi:hypothetical protein
MPEFLVTMRINAQDQDEATMWASNAVKRLPEHLSGRIGCTFAEPAPAPVLRPYTAQAFLLCCPKVEAFDEEHAERAIHEVLYALLPKVQEQFPYLHSLCVSEVTSVRVDD